MAQQRSRYRNPREVEQSTVIVPNAGINQADAPSRLKANEWAAGFDVEPLQSGARRRNGIERQNAVPAGATATENTTGADEFFATTSLYYHSQGFELSSTQDIQSFRVKMEAGLVAAGTVKAAIYTDNAGAPSAAVSGADFADFNAINATDLPASADWVTFSIPASVELTLTTQYHLVIKFDYVDTGIYGTKIIGDDGGNPYADGTRHYKTRTGSWTEEALDDLVFSVAGDAVPITGIFQYKQTNSSVERHILTTTQEIYKNVAGVLTSVGQFDSDTGVNVFPSACVAGDRLCLTNGVDLSQIYFDDDIDPHFENEGLSKPVAGCAAVAVAGGALLATTEYFIDFKYWDEELGRESNSNYSGDLTAAPSATTNPVNKTIRVSALPADIARAGDHATHIRIYIREAADAQFRYSGFQVALGTTTIDITADNRTYIDEYDHDVPPIHGIKLAVGVRQFIADIDGDRTALMWSRVSGIDHDEESFPLGNYRRFGEEGDRVTALAFVPPYTVLVGLQNSVYAIDARNPGSGAPVLLTQGIGIAHHKAVTVIGRMAFFISDSEEAKGPMAWDGQRVRPMPQLDRTFKEELNLSRLQYASCGYLAPGDNRYQWWTLVSTLGAASHDRVLVFDTGLGAWTMHRLSGNVIGQYAESTQSEIFLGGISGIEFKADTGDTDDGAAIEGTLQLKAFSFGSPMNVKLVRGMDYVVESKASGDIGLSVDVDFGAKSAAAAVVAHQAGTGSVLGTGVLGSFLLGAGTNPTLSGRVRIRKSGRYFQPTFSASDPFHIHELSWLVQMLGRQ